MAETGAERTTNPEIHLRAPPPEGFWARLEWYHQTGIVVGGLICTVFGAGMGFSHLKTSVVLADEQRLVDTRQDGRIQALETDSGNLHLTVDYFKDEVRAMRMDLRDVQNGRRLAPLPEPESHPTPARDPSMGLPLPTATPKKAVP